MPPRLIDSHAHIDSDTFQGEVDALLERARDAGLIRIVSIGIHLDSCRKTLALCREHEMIVPALGIHPNEANITDETFAEFVELFDAADPRPVALGEIGLDTYWDYCPIELQERRFREQIAMARERDLPIIIHCRDAYDQLVEVVEDEAFGHGVVHCFGGTPQHAERLLARGFHISFAGNVTYKNAENLREAARVVPLERLLLETDSPYLAPVPKRGQRNESSFVAHTGRFLAELLGVDFDEFAERATRNTIELFRLDEIVSG